MASASQRLNSGKFNYAKYGYMFIAPFFIAYILFSAFPLIYTFVLGFFDSKGIGNFVGLKNYQDLLLGTGGLSSQAVQEKFFIALGNTFEIWLLNFLPQIALSLLLAVWFTDIKLKIKGKGFFKVVMYMPNIITAASVAALFLRLLGENNTAPVNSILMNLGLVDSPVKFVLDGEIKKKVISFIQIWMWYGNTMIYLMAGIMGISPSLFEAANIDGANSRQVFTKVTVPLLKPILLYTVITSMIGGMQMFDIPLLFRNGDGINEDSKTIAIFIYERYNSAITNYGQSGAASVILYIITGIMGIFVFRIQRDNEAHEDKKRLKKQMKQAKLKAKGRGGLDI